MNQMKKIIMNQEGLIVLLVAITLYMKVMEMKTKRCQLMNILMKLREILLK